MISLTTSQIFQQLSNDKIAAPDIPSPVSILEAQSSPVKGVHVESRSGDPSAVAGASILASLSNFRKDLSLLPPPAKSGEELQQDAEMSVLPSGCGGSSVHTPGADMKDCTSFTDQVGTHLREKGTIPSDINNENPNLDNVDGRMDAEVGKIAGATYELRPLLRMLAGSSPDFDIGGSISKMLDEQRQIREILKQFDPPMLISTRLQAFKDKLEQGIIYPDDIDVSFESFPYYLR